MASETGLTPEELGITEEREEFSIPQASLTENDFKNLEELANSQKLEEVAGAGFLISDSLEDALVFGESELLNMKVSQNGMDQWTRIANIFNYVNDNENCFCSNGSLIIFAPKQECCSILRDNPENRRRLETIGFKEHPGLFNFDIDKLEFSNE